MRTSKDSAEPVAGGEFGLAAPKPRKRLKHVGHHEDATVVEAQH